MPKKDGGPAFPMPITKGGDYCQYGMSLRDYFAAKAMEALLTGAVSSNEGAKGAMLAKGPDMLIEDYVAQWAYGQADAMLEARER